MDYTEEYWKAKDRIAELEAELEGRVELRPELREFAEALELRLRKNDHKRGWNEMSVSQCLTMTHQEIHELDIAFRRYCAYEGAKDEVLHESEDAANFLFFLWWNARRVLT